MLSKKQLFNALDVFFNTLDFSTKGLNAQGLSNETYGKKSMIYIHAGSVERRNELEVFLIKLGHKVHTNYNRPDGMRSEVQVSYFKGFHWDE